MPDKPEILAQFFQQHDQRANRHYVEYCESEVQKIADLLRNMDCDYWRWPRIYIVLRTIGALESIKCFLDKGISDLWFPFPPESLPHGLSPASAVKFREVQRIVLAENSDVENGQHRHLSEDHLEDGLFPKHLEWKRDLGRGGFGYVYEVRGRKSSKEYALKQIRRGNSFLEELEAMKYIKSELEVLKKLRGCRHFVKLIGSYTSPRYVGLIMSPVAENNLETFLSQVPGSTDKRNLLWGFFGCLAGAVAYLHFNLHIRHKDIKPQNILVKGNNVLLTDFGMALDWGDIGKTTTQKELRISLLYCAPEAGNDEPRRSSSDIWSLGCVYLEIITAVRGKMIEEIRPFFDNNGSRKRPFWENGEAVSLWIEQLRGSGSSQFENEPLNWIERMLQRNESERPDARELRDLILASSADQSRMGFCGPCCQRVELEANPESENESTSLESGNSQCVEQGGVQTPDAQRLLQANGFGIRGDDLRGTGRRGLDWAVSQGHEMAVQLLLDNMVDPNQKWGNGETPLHVAVSKGDEAVVRILSVSKADLDAKNDSGWPPLHVAARTGQAKMLELLLQLGADINVRGHARGCEGFTILHTVASEGTYDMAKILIQNGADVNAMDDYNIRPLARLADKNYGWSKPYRKRDSWDEDLAKLLISKGAEVNAVDVWGLTALHRAAVQGNVTVIKILIESGADVAKAAGGETPFDWAKDHEEAQRLLKVPASGKWEGIRRILGW